MEIKPVMIGSEPVANVALTPALQLARFFNPRSVAFVGATEDQTKFGGKCMASLMNFGFRGRVMPVNPKRSELFGVECFASLSDLPEVPDHVGIALAGERALDALEQSGRNGVPFATVFSAGFLETGTPQGRMLTERLRGICRETGIRVMGPNCNGVVSFIDRFAMTSTHAIVGGHRAAGDIGIASQSGGAGQINVMWRAMQAGLGISYQVSCGNDADLDLLDYVEFMLESESTKVVLVVAEHITSGARLKAIAEKAAQLDKPVLMMKAGRSAAGSAAAASHTGSITGADDIADAALAQWGIVRVDDTQDLYEFAKLFRRSGRPKGRRVSASSISGGNLVVAVDVASMAGLEWPAFGPTASKGLAALLPDFGNMRNPLDLTAAAIGTDDMLVRAGEQILADDGIDTYVPAMTMARRAEIDAVTQFALNSAKQPVILWTGGCIDDPLLGMADLVRLGVPVYDDAVRCFRAIAASARLAENRSAMKLANDEASADGHRMNAGPAAALRASMTERESKDFIGGYGLPVTIEALARDEDEAVRIALRIAGPVALKIESVDIAHKTEAGAIRLGVKGEAGIRAAFAAVMESARRYSPHANIAGVLVQEMVKPGLELLLGVVNDPVFGPVVTVGAGGVHVEVLRDVASRVAPVHESAARDMLKSLRIWPILAGTRGQAAYDISTVVEAICALSRLVVQRGAEIAEIDINPLVVHAAGQGASVVDALVIPKTLPGPEAVALPNNTI